MAGINKLYICVATYYRALEEGPKENYDTSIQNTFFHLADFIQEVMYFLGQCLINDLSDMKTTAVGKRLVER